MGQRQFRHKSSRATAKGGVLSKLSLSTPDNSYKVERMEKNTMWIGGEANSRGGWIFVLWGISRKTHIYGKKTSAIFRVKRKKNAILLKNAPT